MTIEELLLPPWAELLLLLPNHPIDFSGDSPWVKELQTIAFPNINREWRNTNVSINIFAMKDGAMCIDKNFGVFGDHVSGLIFLSMATKSSISPVGTPGHHIFVSSEVLNQAVKAINSPNLEQLKAFL